MSEISQKYHFAEHIALSEVDAEIVLLNLENGQYFGLNSTGAIIAKLIQEGKTLDQIGQQLNQQFDTNLKSALSDTKELIDLLVKQDLLIAAA
jgi:hypothetical protein